MNPIYPIQALSILFAVACAFHDAPAVSKFERDGITGVDLAAFHKGNFLLKLVFCGLAAFSQYPDIRLEAFSGGLAAFWVWLVFDPALCLKRQPSRSWHYLGLNDGDGRFWNGLFGQNSGIVKAFVLFAAIITLNYIFICGI